MNDTIETQCPSCKGKLRHGIQTNKGRVKHVIWCPKSECRGCIGEGSMLEDALAELAKRFDECEKQ